jgi:hypothetical protein
MSKTKFIVICSFLIYGVCFAASFQDVAKQKKGSGEEVELFFRPQSSSSNAAQLSETKKKEDLQETKKSSPKPTERWATSIRGILKN